MLMLCLFSDTMARISKIEPKLQNIDCDQIGGFVIYNLPGRDCAAKVSNGELAAGDIFTLAVRNTDSNYYTVPHYLLSHSDRHAFQEIPQRRAGLGHRARFPAQPRHQRQLDNMPELSQRLQTRRRLRASAAQPAQRCHVRRCRPR